MSSDSDSHITIRNATLRHAEGLHQIRIDSGRIAGLAPEDSARPNAETEIDAEGGLVTEAFVNGYFHLCKVYTLDQLGDGALKDYHAAGMGGAMSAVERAIVYGTGYIRAFDDTDTTARLEGVKGVMAVRDRFRDSIRIDVVAFPQDGLIRDPGAEELIREALELGADVVGGIPWIEFTDADAYAHVERMCDLAREYDRDISMLVDDVFDAYYPFGRNSMLEVAFLASHLLWMTSPQEIETLYDMITVHAARVVGLEDYCLREGCRADLVILRETRVDHALAEHAPPRMVLHAGRVVARDGRLVDVKS